MNWISSENMVMLQIIVFTLLNKISVFIDYVECINCIQTYYLMGFTQNTCCQRIKLNYEKMNHKKLRKTVCLRNDSAVALFR